MFPKYSNNVPARKEDIVLLLPSIRDVGFGTGAEATSRTTRCWVDPESLIVTAQHVILGGGGGANWGRDGSANYLIVCMKKIG